MTTPALPGVPLPLGVTLDERGANFTLGSATAEGVILCLVDSSGNETAFELAERDYGIWHGYLPDIKAGQRYGYRVHGPWDPDSGLRFDPSLRLVDPYARAICEGTDGGPLGVIVDERFEWADDRRPCIPLADSVIYEVHVKGFTQLHPEIPASVRGTYAGLAHPAALEHLTDLGITAVELLPVHQFITEPQVHDRGLINYWGYNTLGYLAPHAGYSARYRAGDHAGQVAEFKAMVKSLHAVGLEVILDVVFNHTCEGGPNGPTLSFRGIDNSNYYRLDSRNRSAYVDTTGCGNSLNADSIIVLRLIMDSLRMWVQDMHVDGFRFDLAPTLAREHGVFARTSPFFDIVAQDPILSTVKLIAEPWDLGQSDSYDIGRFPALWSEWNGSYRDTIRNFWRSTAGLLPRYATRITGSSDLFGHGLRRPSASINFITAHDGFTLADLVSYDRKHNEANGEDNRDGSDDNLSWNRGAEGSTDDSQIIMARKQAQRTMLAALFTSFGVPMLLGGDEIGRTQQGNNNAYCQDNEISWFDWATVDEELLAFTKRLIQLRRAHPVLRRRRYLTGVEASEVRWFTPSAREMVDADWADDQSRAVAIALNGHDDLDRDPQGAPVRDDDMLLLINAWWEPLTFTIPALARSGDSICWSEILQTSDASSGDHLVPVTGSVEVPGRSMSVLIGRHSPM